MSCSAVPPQTPMGPPRSMQTPHKTPASLLRTPMRTPGEQTSYTPVINFEAIEAQKENVQPLLKGRSAHALSNALSQRQATLKAQRSQYEATVNSQDNKESDDPLEAWTRYVKWCVDSYPSGQTNDSELLLVLERCTRLFKDSPQYQSDSRYLRLWILYARNVDCPSDIYNFLLANEIGTSLASLYEELAVVYEGLSSFEKADETYRMGIHRSAHPLDRLKRRYLEFQKRMIASEGLGPDANGAYKTALKQAMAKAQRAMLGNKVGSGSMSANTVRAFGGQGGLDGVKMRETQNGAKPSLFKDKDGDDVFARPSVKGGWSDAGTSASRKQETKSEAKQWKGEVLPQREVITPKKPAISVYRDSDEEDDDAPAKVRGADVFSTLTAAKEPSATDQLRRNPLLHYEEHERSRKLQPAATKRPKKDSSVNSSKPRVASTSSSANKQENYALPLHLLYPGIRLEEAGQKRSKRERSGEMSIEELLAQERGVKGDQDAWAHLDEQQGRWLPEPKRVKEKTIRRDATVTAFTREAQDQVMEMFNAGMVDSDDESSDQQSDSEEEDDDQPLAPMQMLKENSAVPPTPTPAPKGERIAEPVSHSAAMMATPIRKPFGERQDQRRFGERALPQRLQEETVEEEESDSEAEEVDYLNAPMREMMPLSPITEATEYTRYTHSIETPGIASRYVRDTADDTTPVLNDAAVNEEGVERGADDVRMQSQSKQAEEEREYSLSDTASESAGCGSVWAGSQWGDKDKTSQRMPTGYTIEQGSQNGEEQHFNASLVIIDDLPNPCCPIDPKVTDAILENLSLSIESSSDYVDCRNLTSKKLDGLQSRAQATHRRTSSNNTGSIPAIPHKWTLGVLDHSFPILQKLGEGGYGAVFLAEDDGSLSRSKRILGGINGDASFADVDDYDVDDEEDDEAEKKLFAIKVETPPNRWEFYILGQLRARLTAAQLSSIICARKFFCFEDESFLILEYGEKGTLLEIVNNAANAGVASSTAIIGQASGSVGIDEILAMFFVVEIIKVVQSLHAVDLLHGDIKIDNCLLRLDEPKETWTNSYNRFGQNGWSSKGVTLIDFGRAINLRTFKPDQRFVADWPTDGQDCIEIQRGQSWKYEIDYHGIASIAYCLLFGKYIELLESASDGFQAVDKPFRRYWQVDLWTSLFRLCLNSGRLSREGTDVAEELDNVRSQMESWLEENCFRAGKNLKGSLKKLEIWSIKRSS